MNLSAPEIELPPQSLIWPPQYGPIIRARLSMQTRLKEDRTLQTTALRYYKTHPVEWIEDWCITFDPRLKGMKKVPFVLFPRQREFIEFLVECWSTGESGLTEKCRDVGASWLCVAFSLWLWLFHPGSTIGWGSRKAEYVDDKENPKAIFPKIRQLIRSLPDWMLPVGFDMAKHGTYMKIINPANDASITGEAGDGIGRGGRTTIYFKDESAHYERPEQIEAALGDNTNVQIDISSVNGSANVFYRRRFAKTSMVWRPGAVIPHGFVRVFIFDWRDHPGKTQEWYDARFQKAESEGLAHIHAQEVDRDYAGSVVGVIIPAKLVKAAIDAHKKLASWGNWYEGEKKAAQDIADGGIDRNALVGMTGSVVTTAQHWPGESDDAAAIAIPICVENGYRELYYDSIGVGSGFKAGIKDMQAKPSWPSWIQVMKWNAGSAPLDPDDTVIPGADPKESPTNAEQYSNLKAQSAFRLRSRFVKTYNAVMKGQRYPVDELISLPSDLENVHELEAEISQPVSKSGTNGKTIVDKKPEGSRSPNLFDALNMCNNPTRELSIYDVL